MDIEIEDTITGKRLTMEVEHDMTIGSLTDELLNNYGEPSDEETYGLIFRNKNLNPDKTLQDYKIKDGDKLQAVPIGIIGGWTDARI